MNSTEAESGGTNTTAHNRRRWKLAVAAVVMALSPFVLLELGLRAAGVGDEAVDLHDGFGAAIPLFTLQEKDEVWRTSLPRQRFFYQQEFPDTKSGTEFRIFCLGGSTVQGRPYEPTTSFAKWVELELNAINSDRTYRVINCGGVSYASYRLRPILKEVLNYQPDLIILATGHNEFLEARTYADLKTRSSLRMQLENSVKSLRTVMILRELTGGAARVEPAFGEDPPSQTVEARLDDDSGYASYHRDEEWQQLVCNHYSQSVRDIFSQCSNADVPIITVKLGSNLRDCPPFKSEHAHDLAPADERKWQDLFDQATSTEADDVTAALILYRQAEEIDDRFPLLHFRIARCLDLLNRPQEAAVAFDRALQEDICPLRMISAVENQLTAAAEEFGVPLVDAKAAVAATSPDHIPGYDAYLDHVHPTIAGHQTIARKIVDRMIEVNIVEPTKRLSGQQRRKLCAAHISQLGNIYFSNGRRRIGWLEGWARRKRLYDETIPIDARGYMVTALRYLDLHEFDLAGDNLQMAVAMNEDTHATLVQSAAVLFSQGRTDAARWVLEQLRIAKLGESVQHSIDTAELIIACDSQHDAKLFKTVYDRHENWAAILNSASSDWVQLMPDVLSKADGLTSMSTSDK